MAVLFNIILWLVGIVNTNDKDVLEDVKARGKCRQIVVENNVVKIKFISPEDAKIFAKDLKTVIESEK